MFGPRGDEMDRNQGSPPSFRNEGVLCVHPGCFRPPGHTGQCRDLLRDPLPTFGTGVEVLRG